MARIRLGSGESARAFKGVICDDISESGSVNAIRVAGTMSFGPLHGKESLQISRFDRPLALVLKHNELDGRGH
jgi:hypothetical protein